MTGNDILAIRTRLGVTADELAQMLGVSTVTWYRWERMGNQSVPLDNLKVALLTKMEQGIGQAQHDKKDPQTFGQLLVNAMVVGGIAWAIYQLLQEGFKKK